MWQLVISAFVIGLLSSLHCVGMCGPIAFALPVKMLQPSKKIIAILLYNIGRISTYSILGCFFGLVGRQFFIGGFQQWLSIVLGVFVLVVVLGQLAGNKKWHVHFMDKAYCKVQAVIAIFIGRKQLYAMFLLGAANGLLPCGMVYLALTGAIASGTVYKGMLFMILFGCGTFPAMFLLSYFGVRVGLSARNVFKKVSPYVALFVGVLLILRGLNLNIPYVSPYLQNTTANTISCH
jgi:sulfite exporter TauE/SafE